jgi:hypothetical protein
LVLARECIEEISRREEGGKRGGTRRERRGKYSLMCIRV